MIITCFYAILNGLPAISEPSLGLILTSTSEVGRCHFLLQMGKLRSSNLPKVSELKEVRAKGPLTWVPGEL
jgi:hypothetical protein